MEGIDSGVRSRSPSRVKALWRCYFIAAVLALALLGCLAYGGAEPPPLRSLAHGQYGYTNIDKRSGKAYRVDAYWMRDRPEDIRRRIWRELGVQLSADPSSWTLSTMELDVEIMVGDAAVRSPDYRVVVRRPARSSDYLKSIYSDVLHWSVFDRFRQY